jgi:hypothetical protein
MGSVGLCLVWLSTVTAFVYHSSRPIFRYQSTFSLHAKEDRRTALRRAIYGNVVASVLISRAQIVHAVDTAEGKLVRAHMHATWRYSEPHTQVLEDALVPFIDKMKSIVDALQSYGELMNSEVALLLMWQMSSCWHSAVIGLPWNTVCLAAVSAVRTKADVSRS